jgi:hypothetical protein
MHGYRSLSPRWCRLGHRMAERFPGTRNRPGVGIDRPAQACEAAAVYHAVWVIGRGDMIALRHLCNPRTLPPDRDG